MQTNADGSASRKKVGATRRLSTPNGSRRNSSVRADDLRRRGLDHAVQRYADLFDFAPIGYVSFDRSGRIEEINLTASRLFGMPRDRLVGMPFMVFVAREDTALFLDHLLRCRASDTQVETDLRLKDVHRKMIHAYLSSIPVPASLYNGTLLYQTAIIDLTSRDVAETALRKKEAELELITTQTPFMLTRCTRDLRYRYVSRAYAEMLGRHSDEINGKPLVEIMGKEGLKTILPYINTVLEGHTAEYEMEVAFKAIGTRWLHCVYTPDRDSDGNVIGWFASLTDIGLRKKAEAVLQKSKQLLEKRVRQRTRELHAANKELEDEIERRKGLEGEILSVSDREQQRLGQELHDGLCQHLTAVAFMARSVALRLRNHRVIDASDIEKIAELVNNAAADTRELSRALHRVDVDAASLVTALQDLVDREIWKIPCRLQVRPSFHIDDNIAAAHLYRIAREAVINASKHSQARQIVIKLERSQLGMVLRVIDDGVGFSTKSKLKRGMGFHIMNYRAQLIGGRLKIERPQKGGTCVSCYLPDGASQPRESRTKENGQQRIFAGKITKALAALV